MLKPARYLFFLLFLLSGSFAFSQTDSLDILLPKAKTDSDRFVLYCRASFKERKNDVEKAIAYADKAIDLAKKNFNLHWEAKAYNFKGLAQYYNSDYNNAIETCENALRIGREVND